MSTTATTTLELQDFLRESPLSIPADVKLPRPASIRVASGQTSGPPSRDEFDTLPSPTTAVVHQQQRWNQSRVHVFRTLCTFWSFIVLGANDAAIGALIPYLETYYDLSYSVVSLVFLSPFVGYCVSALLNNWVHAKFGQRGIAIFGPTAHVAAYVVSAVHPPFAVIVVVYMVAGFGNGVLDAAWNARTGSLQHANELLGILHACYGLGATIAPIISSAMTAKYGLPWYTYYYIMIGFACLELVTSALAFWSEDGAAYRAAHQRTTDAQGAFLKEALFKKPAARVTWLVTAFLLFYTGSEVALGGWIVTFMREIRHGGAFASGMTATGFWLGLTIGRVILGFVTPWLGEQRAILIYLPIAMAMELCFWLIPQFIASAVSVAFVGFLLGPLFPAAIVAISRLLPRHLHVSAIGFAAAAGGGGAAIFPFAVGAIAQAKGVGVLQPIVLALLVVIFLVWICLPRMSKKDQ